MSYILDALKKSDQERKRGDIPNLQTVHIPVSVEQRPPWLLYGFIALLLLLLAFVVGVMISAKSKDGLAEVSEKAEAIEVIVKEKNIALKTEDNSGVGSDTASEIEKPLEKKERAKKDPEKTAYQQKKSAETHKKKPPVIAQAAEPVRKENNIADLSEIPYLSELPEYKQQSIPEMSFAGHVYSSSASSRSVIINGYAMSEGDTIVQGINVEQITPNGVVFSLHNELFRVDILQDWSFE